MDSLYKPSGLMSLGAFKVDSLVTIRHGVDMATKVRDAMIGSNLNYGLGSYGKKNVNQLKGLIQMGSEFIRAVTTFWSVSTRDAYQQIKDVQSAGLAFTSAALSAKGTLDYFIADRRRANLKVAHEDAASTGRLTGAKTASAILTDLVSGLINFATTSAKAICFNAELYPPAYLRFSLFLINE